MILDSLNIKRRRGIGLIVLLSFPVLGSGIAFILLIRKMAGSFLRSYPEIRVGRSSLGNGGFWGFILILFSSIFMFLLDRDKAPDHAESGSIVLYMFLLPMLLTGVFLLIYQIIYSANKKAMEELLRRIVISNGVLSPADLEITDLQTGVKTDKLTTKMLLKDLVANDIVSTRAMPNDLIGVEILSPELQRYQMEHRKEFDLPRVEMESWECPCCGAGNSSPAGSPSKCEYCGESRASKPKEREWPPRWRN